MTFLYLFEACSKNLCSYVTWSYGISWSYIPYCGSLLKMGESLMTILDGFIQLLTMAYDGSLSSQIFSKGILVCG